MVRRLCRLVPERKGTRPRCRPGEGRERPRRCGACRASEEMRSASGARTGSRKRGSNRAESPKQNQKRKTKHSKRNPTPAAHEGADSGGARGMEPEGELYDEFGNYIGPGAAALPQPAGIHGTPSASPVPFAKGIGRAARAKQPN